MLDLTTTADFVIEIKRYDDTEMYGFHTFIQDDEGARRMVPGNGSRYRSIPPVLHNFVQTVLKRVDLGTEGYSPYTWIELPDEMKAYIVRSILPLEFKQMPESFIDPRICVWVKDGERIDLTDIEDVRAKLADPDYVWTV